MDARAHHLASAAEGEGCLTAQTTGIAAPADPYTPVPPRPTHKRRDPIIDPGWYQDVGQGFALIEGQLFLRATALLAEHMSDWRRLFYAAAPGHLNLDGGEWEDVLWRVVALLPARALRRGADGELYVSVPAAMDAEHLVRAFFLGLAPRLPRVAARRRNDTLGDAITRCTSGLAYGMKVDNALLTPALWPRIFGRPKRTTETVTECAGGFHLTRTLLTFTYYDGSTKVREYFDKAEYCDCAGKMKAGSAVPGPGA